MQQFKMLCVAATLGLALVGCGSDKEKETPKPGTGDDIDVTVETTQNEKLTLLTITYKVYVKGHFVKEYTRVDTLPNLGLNLAADTTYDDDGNVDRVNKDTVLNSYRLFITSK